jgi:hypothetical protein
MNSRQPSPSRPKNRRLLASLAIACGCILAAGCLDEDTEEDCMPMPLFCDRTPPSSASLTILTGGGTLQEIRVYSGTAYETGTLVWSGTSARTLRLPLGDYSATATYLVNGKTVVAVDGDYLDYESSEYCEGTCYDEVGGTVDLTLE